MTSILSTRSLLHAARALGGNVVAGRSITCPGPGHSRSDRSLSVTFCGDNLIVHSFAGDDWRTCKEYVRSIVGGDSKMPPMTLSPIPQEALGRSERALQIWSEARELPGTPGQVYLRKRGVSYSGATLRWHPSCPFGPEVRVGCIIALVTNIATNEPVAIHRTAVSRYGEKLSHLGSNGRMALGPVKGGAIRLFDPDWVSLGVAEGIETALSIRTMPDLDQMPVWALLNAGQLSTFPALPHIDTLWVARDHDPAGFKSVEALCARYHRSAKEVVILATDQEGKDLNDLIKETR